MEVGTVRQINIDNEMQASYLDYALSVIVSRALPDVRDGLKPVHRRILYAMHDLGLTSDKPYKKSARIVGEVLGKYHPHGDAAVYEAMVRMAQDFSLRYPLVDGQGNFGSVDGDNAAAMRYTEARLSSIANEMLADIDKDTVDWSDNFDGTLREPTVLPAALPNLVVNGAAGIAVGMATNIPPHNLGEVCDALCYLIDNYKRVENVSTEDLMRFIQGPDFPTGGIVFRYAQEGNGAEAERVDAIEKAYGSGKGSLVVQARAHIEEMSRNRNRIVVTELPYQTDKSRLLERIAELVRDGRIEGITDLRDESDRTGMRICVELTRTVDARQVLADLYKYTPLQSTFGVSLLALVDGEPRLLSIKKMLVHFIEHRQNVILRRSRYELEKARQRAHILEGLLRALDVLDEIIALIRGSRSADAARLGLKSQFGFTELQAQAILDMQLRRLAALERQKLADEYKQIQKLIKELEALVASPQRVLALIRTNLTDLKARYADARRTQIADRTKAVLTAREHAIERDVWLAVSGDGKLAVYNRSDAETLRKGGAVIPAPSHPVTQAPRHLLAANTRQDLYLFTKSGRVARVPGHQWPDAPGTALSDLAGIKEPVAALIVVTPPDSDEAVPGYLVLGTAQGKVKRINLSDLLAQAHAGPQVIGLDEEDCLIWAAVSQGDAGVLLVTATGQAIRFAEEDVRAMGLPAGGIGGIKLREGDRVVAGFVLARPVEPTAADAKPSRRKQSQAPAVAIVTDAGFIKKVPLDDFPTQGRYGIGVMATSLSARSGQVAGAALLGHEDILVSLTASGASQAVATDNVPIMARASQGKALVSLAKGDRVERVYSITSAAPASPNGNGGGDGNGPTRDSPDLDGSQARAPRRSAGPRPASPTGNGAPGSPNSIAAGPQPTAARTPARTQEPAPPEGTRSAAPEAAAKARASRPPVEAGADTSTSKTRRKAAAPVEPAATIAKAPAERSKATKPAEPARARLEATTTKVADVAIPGGDKKRSRRPATLGAPEGPEKAVAASRSAAKARKVPAAPVKRTAAEAPAAEQPAAPTKPSPKRGTAQARQKAAPATSEAPASTQPHSRLEVARTPTTVSYDREALRQATGLDKPGSAVKGHPPTAQQLPLMPPEAGEPNAPARRTVEESATNVQAPAPRGTRQSAAQPKRPAAAGKSGQEKPAATQTGPAAADAAGKTRPGAAKKDKTPAPPTAAPGSGTPWPRAKRSAVDGPMTWPKVPARAEDEDEVPPPPPRRPRSRP